MAQPSFSAHIRIEGLKEVQAALRNAENKLPKALGEAHKEIGQFIIGKLPQGSANAIGTGTGSVVRASATKRDVVLRVGGAHRAAIAAKRHVGSRVPQWGKTEVQPFVGRRGNAPYIIGTMEDNRDEILEVFKQKYLKLFDPAFWRVR